MNLENDLKRALHRESPAPGFADRVLARIEAEEARAAKRRPVWWRAVAASLTLTAVLGGWTAHEVAQRRAAEAQGERAKEQVLLALRIASEKLSYAQQEVHRIGKAD